MANALRTQGQQHAPLSLSPLLGEQVFGPYLVLNGLIDLKEMLHCKADARRSRASFTEILYASGLIDPRLLVEAEASFRGLTRADLASHPADPALAALCDPAFWLKHSAIPWGWHEDTLLIAVSDPASFATLAKALPPILQSAKPALALQSEIDAAIAEIFREELTARAFARVPESESCRTWGRTPHRRITLLCLGLLALMAAVVLWPKVIVSALVLWAIFAMALSAIHKILAVFAFLAFPDPPSKPPSELAQMPRISVLVPLFREPEIAQVLVRRISRLTYPKHLLDVVLVLEETDTITRDALENASFPPWMRKIVVPDGHPRTKPRAMNYALDFCKGDIIGIWDAEDAPEPHQLDLVAEKFRTAPPDLVCLQGALDYYNPKQNWLARCFTIEYASWFRTVLSSLCRLGFAIPLGGTTLFFRRDVLEQLGGWDAHNVTEDADLGFRLARHGYRTGMIATATGEEANCKAWPLVKQRSLAERLHGHLSRRYAKPCAPLARTGRVEVSRLPDTFHNSPFAIPAGPAPLVILADLLWPSPPSGRPRAQRMDPDNGYVLPRVRVHHRRHRRDLGCKARAHAPSGLGANAAPLLPAGDTRGLQGALGTPRRPLLLGQDHSWPFPHGRRQEGQCVTRCLSEPLNRA